MSQWQPIESAPKDGTRVLLAGTAEIEGTGKNYPWKVTPGYYLKGPHLGQRHNWMWGIIFPPTHWMPLPSPPDKDSKDARP